MIEKPKKSIADLILEADNKVTVEGHCKRCGEMRTLGGDGTCSTCFAKIAFQDPKRVENPCSVCGVMRASAIAPDYVCFRCSPVGKLIIGIGIALFTGGKAPR